MFVELLLSQRLVTQVFRKKMFPEALAKCVLCIWGEEDCSHLFYECQFAPVVWAIQPISLAVVSSAEAFWGSLQGGIFSKPVEQGWPSAVLWEIWSHRKKGFVYLWIREIRMEVEGSFRTHMCSLNKYITYTCRITDLLVPLLFLIKT